MSDRTRQALTKEASPDLASLPRQTNWAHLGKNPKGERPWGKWNHQYRAYQFVIRYLTRKPDPGKERAALIRMPTGSGKTGIMALIANYELSDSSLLIVVPSEFLTEQICEALNSKYWLAIGQQPPRGPKPAVWFVPSTLEDALDTHSEPSVFVCTTQTLAMIRPDVESIVLRKWHGLYHNLSRRIGAVLVDEGHREPAKTWAKAVRGLNNRIILFSATPYRNDLRMFRIGRGEDYRFSFRFHEAVNARVIRKIEFRGPDKSFIKTKAGRSGGRDAEAFASQLVKFYRGVLLKQKPANVNQPKVIVRCESIYSARAVHAALAKIFNAESDSGIEPSRLLRAIAIHEELGSSGVGDHMSQPPESHDSRAGAIFWVHQFKLTEGLDDKDFCAIAFFEPFKNSRSLVQQVGRVIRNASKNNTEEQGFVYADPADNLQREWQDYLLFEESRQDIIGASDIVESIREAQPEWYYSAGRYRRGATFTREEIIENLRLPAAAHVYLRPPDFSAEDLKDLASLLSEEMEDHDMTEVELIRHSPTKFTHVIAVLHWEVIQSDRLDDKGFFDISLVATCLYMNQRYIFHNGRLSLRGLPMRHDLELVEVDCLTRLVPAKDTTVKQLALVNCDLGDGAVRRKALGGRTLDTAAVSLNDHLHFLSSMVVRNSSYSRHIGLQRSTVTDRGAELISLDQFCKWAEGIGGQLQKAHVIRHRILRRYAEPVRTPKEAQAKHLLIDLADFWDEFTPEDEPVGNDFFSQEFLATACDVTDGQFVCVIAGETISGTIEYNRGRFRIISKDMDKAFKPRTNTRRRPSTFLSKPTLIQVVTDKRLIYADRRFYSAARLHGSRRVHDLDLIVTVPGLENIVHNEKGEPGEFEFDDKGEPCSWQKGSLFYQIDSNHKLFQICRFNPDILLCDDLGTEAADFVAVDLKNKKIAIIHAKVLDSNRGLSAKDLHEIVAQAKKNLGFLDPAEFIPTQRGAKWDKMWKWKKNDKFGLKRIRKSGSFENGDEILSEIQKLLHTTSFQKEVWLVLGNGFSVKSLREVVLSEDDPPYHWIQLLYLIHSCHASVAAIGARLRILTGDSTATNNT